MVMDLRRVARISLVSTIALAAGSAHAQTTFNVPSVATPTIQSAINAAALSGDTVLVAPGLYDERINFLGKSVLVQGSPANPTLTVIDPSTNSTAEAVVNFVTSETSGAILDGFTVAGHTGSRGAGIRVGTTLIAASPIIRNTIVRDNITDSSTSTFRRGAGAAIQSPSTPPLSAPTFENVTFQNNKVGSATRTSGTGGAVAVNQGNPTFTNCTFTGNGFITANLAASFYGGAVSIVAGTSTFTGCTFTGNSSPNGGALNIEGASTIVNFTNCSFTGNIADVLGATTGTGGVANVSGGTTTFTTCTFTANSSEADAGVIGQEGGSITVTGGSFLNNTGGGGCVYRSRGGATTAGSATFSGVTFTGNTSPTNRIIQMNAVTLPVTAGPYSFENCTFNLTTGQLGISLLSDAVLNVNNSNFINPTTNGTGFSAQGLASTLNSTGCTVNGTGTAVTAFGSGTISNLTITGASLGLRVGNTTTPGTVTITNTTITGGTTGINHQGGTTNLTNVDITGLGLGALDPNSGGVTASPDGTITANDLTVTNCKNNGAFRASGGVSGSITNSTFQNNTGSGGSSVVAFSGPLANVSVTDSLFRANTATSGGGVLQITISDLAATTTVTGNTFDTNTATGGGAGLSIDVNAGPSNVSGNTFTANSFGGGGGASIDAALNSGLVTISGNTITGTSGGPGIELEDNILGTVTGNTIRGGTSGSSGVRLTGAGQAPTISSNLIDGNSNSSGAGAGIDNVDSNAIIVNNLIVNNIGGGGGAGGIGIQGGSPTIANNTITGNTGDGILNDSLVAVTVVNTIISGNTEATAEVTDNGGLLSVTYSNIEGGFAGTGNIAAAPIFENAAGGDYRLAMGSPDIDAGNNAGVPVGITTDQSGGVRFLDDAAVVDTGAGTAPIVDMGALERVAGPTCDPIDFNGDGIFPDNQDLIDFIEVFAGGVCPTGTCNDIDFNNDGIFPDNQDLIDFIEVFAGAPC
jgi:hypothetical protein